MASDGYIYVEKDLLFWSLMRLPLYSMILKWEAGFGNNIER